MADLDCPRAIPNFADGWPSGGEPVAGTQLRGRRDECPRVSRVQSGSAHSGDVDTVWDCAPNPIATSATRTIRRGRGVDRPDRRDDLDGPSVADGSGDVHFPAM